MSLFVYAELFSAFFNFLEVPAIKNIKSKDHVTNESILSLQGFHPGKQVRVIGEDSEQLGIMKLADALDKAD